MHLFPIVSSHVSITKLNAHELTTSLTFDLPQANASEVDLLSIAPFQVGEFFGRSDVSKAKILFWSHNRILRAHVYLERVVGIFFGSFKFTEQRSHAVASDSKAEYQYFVALPQIILFMASAVHTFPFLSYS